MKSYVPRKSTQPDLAETAADLGTKAAYCSSSTERKRKEGQSKEDKNGGEKKAK